MNKSQEVSIFDRPELSEESSGSIDAEGHPVDQTPVDSEDILVEDTDYIDVY